MNVAIYVRTSTSDKQDTGMQKAELFEYVKARGFKVFSVFEDKGYSGTSSIRPALKEMLNKARDKAFDGVLVWKFDRFARSLKDLVLMIHELDDLGLKFISLKDNVDLSTSQGRLMMHLLGAFAQFEADLIKSRVRAGVEHAKRVGTKSGKPFGRPKLRDDNKILELKSQNKKIREIAKELGISKGMVQRSLATVL